MAHIFLVPDPIEILIPTTDSWHPSYDRGHLEEPSTFELCECWECLALKPKEREESARWNWMHGGRVCVFFYPDTRHIVVRGLDDTMMEKDFEFEDDARYFVTHLPAFI